MENSFRKSLNNTKITDCYLLELDKIESEFNRGALSVIEKDILPFEFKRIYYLYDVPSTAVRGGHAHKELYQFLLPLSGSFDVRLNDGENTKIFNLNKPNKGLLLCPGIWRELENFSSGAVCMVIASEVYDEDDYIRDYNLFKTFKK